MPDKPSVQQLMEELRELQACRSAVTDLATPGNDLHGVSRYNLTILMSVLDRHSERVLGDFDQILRPD